MKKFLTILGVVFLCIIIVGVVTISIAAYHGTKLDKSSKAYVDEIVPIILSSWSSDELLNRASPELLKVITQGQLEDMFRMFSGKLGVLKEYKGSEGSSYVNISPSGKITTAAYTAKASFENDDAEIKISLVQHNERWHMLEFRVNSNVLMP